MSNKIAFEMVSARNTLIFHLFTDLFPFWTFLKAKPLQSTVVSAAPVLDKPIMLMKARDDTVKPTTPPEATPQSTGPGPSKVEREGQRPTQPVYQIQNRGMGASATSSAVDRELPLISILKAQRRFTG